jgi:glycosyltransferase involved in cell wall biosynthesis
MAQALVGLLERQGHKILRLDTYAGADSLPPMTPEALPALRAAAQDRVRTLVGRWTRLARDHPDRPTAWVTYHVWYKRPDWLGPAMSRALDIPYVIAEASYAPKRAGGVWDLGHRATEAAVRAADLVLTLNPDDAPCLAPLLAGPQVMTTVPPFLDAGPFRAAASERPTHRAALRRRYGWPADAPVLLAVAMMRPPDKLASYRVLADAMRVLTDRDWRLLLVGDGEARAEVERLFAPQGARVAFAGAQAADVLPTLYAAADLYVWPAINEAYGISLLEAQAAGLPVIAGHTRGVPAVVAEGETGLLPKLGDAAAFAAGVRTLLDDPPRRAAMGKAAARRIAHDHDLAAASMIMDKALDAMQVRRAQRAAAI